ncbi:MAG: hypothetical protein QM831_30375 [Kofleriaceae bacterium]
MYRLILLVAVLGCSKKTDAPATTSSNSSSPPATAVKRAPIAPLAALPDGLPVSATIGAAGGALASSDGLLAITVPAGALAADTKLSVQEIATTSRTGRGYRLEPSGTTFAQPIKLAFSPEPGAHTDGAAVAYKDPSGKWVAPAQTHTPTAIEVATTHFSDWSIQSGIELQPAAASVSKNGVVDLTVQICFTSAPQGDTTPVYINCQLPVGVANMLRASHLMVNGIENGNASVGTVNVSGDDRITYHAPAQVPAPNPVAITVEFTTLPNEHFGKIIGYSSVYVADQPSYFGRYTSVTKHAEGESRGTGYAFWNYSADGKWHAMGYQHTDAILGCPVASGGAAPIDPAKSWLEISDGKYKAHIYGMAVKMVPCQDTAVDNIIDGSSGLETGDAPQTVTDDTLRGTFVTSDPDFPTTYTWEFTKQ